MVFSEENLCFNCNFCPLRFLTENLLSTHIRTKHMATFTMVDCKKCGKSLRSKQLSQHMQTHQEKKFECKLCYKKFSIQKYLEDHQKNVHRSEQHLFEQDLTEIKGNRTTFSYFKINKNFYKNRKLEIIC